jgi:hypothetical protein
MLLGNRIGDLAVEVKGNLVVVQRRETAPLPKICGHSKVGEPPRRWGDEGGVKLGAARGPGSALWTTV